MISKVHWYTKVNRHAPIILHLGIRIWRWRFEIHSDVVTTNVQDGAERAGWPE